MGRGTLGIYYARTHPGKEFLGVPGPPVGNEGCRRKLHLQFGRAISIREAKYFQDGLDCQPLRQNGKNDNAKNQIQHAFPIWESVVEAEGQRQSQRTT